MVNKFKIKSLLLLTLPFNSCSSIFEEVKIADEIVHDVDKAAHEVVIDIESEKFKERNKPQ